MSKNKEFWQDRAYSDRKAAELREQMLPLALPAVADYAGVELHRAEAALLGKERMNEKLYRKLKGAIGHYQAMEAARRHAVPPGACVPLEPETWGMTAEQIKAELQAEEYAAYERVTGEERAVIVRFSRAETDLLVRIFAKGNNVESCLRAFLLYAVKEDAKRLLYCPQQQQPEGRPISPGLVFEGDFGRVAVELSPNSQRAQNRRAESAGLSLWESLRTGVEVAFGAQGEPADAELSADFWRSRAQLLERELTQLKRQLEALADMDN